jgi:hypothetical protein
MLQRLLNSRFAFWRRNHENRTVRKKVMRRASRRALRRH